MLGPVATRSGARPGLGATTCSGWGGATWRPHAGSVELRHTAAAVPPSSEGGGAGCSTSGGACAAARAPRGPRQRQQQQPAARGVACAAYGRGRGSGGGSSDPNYYELLGLDPDCDEEDIKTAFRRRAKELHPDVNKEDGATESFVRLSRAYEVLSDPEARRTYDIQHGTRRFNFFRDVAEDEDEVRRSPFKWSQVDRRQGGGSGLRPDDDSEDAVGRDEDEEDEDEEEDEQGPGWQRQRSPEEFLEDLARVMGGGAGSLRNFQSGRLDPWGTSSSDSWFRQVERQTQSPYGPHRQGYGSSRDDDDDGGLGGREWDPSRRTPGWTPPGRGSEWDHPRRQWDEEDRRGGGPGRQGGGGGGGGGDFRRPFKI
ncbi:hypothetical protein HXX76_014208 [Chlamydomonas incerta]|uniref:J domain-containing protein n=1 Tax=Chlamydomonas incerta TaxID=51695 RepID=A0A835VTC9_CHLIN|nr:hypothetical protein HXX76_014208 [Chlamydomonas incerta]|eukprot:KAG2424784.1 hypothetical protein HXX76_014208 [Chlamydomonas incerta]